MQKDRNRRSLEELTVELYAAFGDIGGLEACGPGVYYFRTKKHGEVYLVEKNSPIISADAKGYGERIEAYPEYLFYSLAHAESGNKIVQYELERYAVLQQQNGHSPKSLHEIAQYATECHPDYFGCFPAPADTPWGFMTRWRTIGNGVYWLETDQGREALAICHVIGENDLSEYARTLERQARSHQDEIDCGYLFFAEKDACVPVFELLTIHPEWKRSGKVLLPELMNALWKYHPQYVLSYNRDEQLGKHDLPSQVLMALGADVEPRKAQENMIALFPHAGTDYLRL